MNEPSMIPFDDEKYFEPKGCHGCRKSQVRCPGQRPSSCARCIRSKQPCSWPPRQLRLRYKRQGIQKNRNGRRILPAILPNSDTIPGSELTPAPNVAASLVSLDPTVMMDNFFNPDFEETAEDDITLEEFMNIHFQDNWDGMQPATFEIAANFPMHDLSDFSHNGSFDFGSFILDPSPPTQVQSASSVMIGAKEQSALGHYQSTFSIYRTTKKPVWSTHTLLLDKGSSNDMIMHFILAVSINDISHRKEDGPSEEAHVYFELAERALNDSIQRDSAIDHTTMMVSFLLLYLYIPKRRSFPRERIQQLSRDVYGYITRHNLDSRCLERSTNAETGDSFSEADRTLLARLIIWIYDEDVKCSFQGFGGYLAKHLTDHRERTMAVCEVSRTALGAHWGERYPEEEAADDDDNAVELEFLWALTTLWQDINQLSQMSEDYVVSKRQVEQRFKLLERKYSTVFHNSAQTTMPRTRTLVNADYDVVLFNALKVYNFRSTLVDLEMDAPENIKLAVMEIFELMHRTFASNKNELHDRLQWPLFLAGIEIEDKFYRDWIIVRLSKRPKAVLETITKVQDATKPRKRMEMWQIRSLLYEPDRNERSDPSMARGYIVDDGVSS